MSFITISPNMNLPVPNVGQEPGPDWANDINNCLNIVDGHTHANGNGVKITPSGLDISSPLNFQAQSASSVLSVDFISQASTTLSLVSIYSVNGELFYNDGNGLAVQITNNGVVGNATAIPGLNAPAQLIYSAPNFVFTSNIGIGAILDAGALIVRDNITPTHYGITIQAPVLAAPYALTLPNATPAQQSFMTMDASGNVAAPWTVDGTTIQIIGNQLVVQPSALAIWEEHSWELNGSYGDLTFPLTGVDSIFLVPFDITIRAVWVYNGLPASSLVTSGVIHYDLQTSAYSGSSTWTSILSQLSSFSSINYNANVLTRVGTVATMTCAGAHGYRNGDTVTIARATQAQYNGTFVVSNVSANTFDYTVAGSPATPATGSPSIILKPDAYTDSNAVVPAQNYGGIAKPIVSTPVILAGSSLRWVITSAGTPSGFTDARIRIFYTRN